MHAALSSQHDGDNRDVLIHTHTLVPSFPNLEYWHMHCCNNPAEMENLDQTAQHCAFHLPFLL
jgi:hypothetical protein